MSAKHFSIFGALLYFQSSIFLHFFQFVFSFVPCWYSSGIFILFHVFLLPRICVLSSATFYRNFLLLDRRALVYFRKNLLFDRRSTWSPRFSSQQSEGCYCLLSVHVMLFRVPVVVTTHVDTIAFLPVLVCTVITEYDTGVRGQTDLRWRHALPVTTLGGRDGCSCQWWW